MRKFIYIIAIGLAMTGLVACTTNTNSNVDVEEEVIPIEDQVDDKEDIQPVVVNGAAPDAVDKDINPNFTSLNDAAIIANGITLKIGDDFKPNIEKVGDADIEEGQACLDEGYDTNYYYNGEDLVVYTYAGEGKQVIYDIYVTSADYKTAKGAQIGTSTMEDIESLYGEANEVVGKSYNYFVESEATVLSFIFDESQVLTTIDVVKAN